jgi:hypothetical protein
MFRTVLIRMLAIALGLAQHGTSASLAAEPLFSSPQVGASIEPLRLPPVDTSTDDIYPSATTGEELPLDLELEADAAREPGNRSRPGMRGGFGGPFGGGGGPPIGYRAFGEPTVDVDAQNATFAHFGQEARFTMPVWTDEPHVVMLSTTIGNDLFDTAAVFPRSGTPFPESLWNVRFGANYIRTLANDWKAGVGLNIGSASDVPYGAIRDLNPAVFAFLGVPRGEFDAWNFGVFYSPLSEIPFPVPMLSYHWHASDELEMNVGLPAQLTYRPTDWFTFTASYMVLHTITARGTWQLDENWSAFLAYENRNRAWFLHDRTRDDERLFAYDQSLLVGLERTFFEKLKAEVTAGYMFERFYFIGEDYADRNRDRIDLAPGLTAAASIGVAF